MIEKQNNKTVLKRLFLYVIKSKLLLTLIFIFSLGSVIFSLLIPVFTGNAIDFIIGFNDVNFKELTQILIALCICIFFVSVLQWFLAYCTNKISYVTIKNMRNDIFKKIGQLPLAYIDKTLHGDIINRMIQDTDIISEGLLQGLTQLFVGIMTIVGTLGIMFSINPFITIAVIVLTPLSLFVASFIAKRTHKMFLENAKVQGALSGYISESVQNMKLIQAFNYENTAYEKFWSVNENLNKIGVKAQFNSALTNPSTRFINSIVFAAVGVFGAIFAVNMMISVGQISSFLIFANQYTKPFNEISGVIAQLQSALASAERVFNLLDEQEQTPEKENKFENSSADVSAEHVYFSYTEDKKLIEDFNLTVKPGTHVAIVGPTGCGKTTIINLLMRFYDVNKGSIKVSGTDIRDVSRKSLMSCYGMVLQDTWLFNGTIKENIAYGKPDATDEEIEAAAKAAHAHNFIKKLPLAYETPISESGSFSQGQRQLLSIARVMLLRPSILILDEATSSIDTMTEIRIQKAFKTLMQGRTSFMVAHRLSTIKNSDIILVMKDGNVIQQGNHKELIQNQSGFYYKLYSSMV